eukprot:4661249-Pleurochrysis_carterae.AAC.1
MPLSATPHFGRCESSSPPQRIERTVGLGRVSGQKLEVAEGATHKHIARNVNQGDEATDFKTPAWKVLLSAIGESQAMVDDWRNTSHAEVAISISHLAGSTRPALASAA